MKIVLISDTHEQHEKVVIPECDVLVHAGDLTYKGEIHAVEKALKWLDRQPAHYVVAIAGNHDFLFEEKPDIAKDLLLRTRIQYLEDSDCEIMGKRFWGSPYSPRFFDWAFNADRGEVIKKHWDKIPSDTDVLITHGPPYGILDQSAPHKNSENLGCRDLRYAVNRVLPKINVFGHIHGGYGTIATVGIDWAKKPVFYNASVVNEAYKVVNKPFEVELIAP